MGGGIFRNPSINVFKELQTDFHYFLSSLYFSSNLSYFSVISIFLFLIAWHSSSIFVFVLALRVIYFSAFYTCSRMVRTRDCSSDSSICFSFYTFSLYCPHFDNVSLTSFWFYAIYDSSCLILSSLASMAFYIVNCFFSLYSSLACKYFSAVRLVLLLFFEGVLAFVGFVLDNAVILFSYISDKCKLL